MQVVGIVAELGAGVQRREDQLQGRFAELGVHVHGDAAAIVTDRHRVARLVQRHRDAVGVTVEVFIDGVIDDFPDQMVQSLLVRIADIHRWPFAHRLESFEDGDVFGGVVRGRERGGHLNPFKG